MLGRHRQPDSRAHRTRASARGRRCPRGSPRRRPAGARAARTRAHFHRWRACRGEEDARERGSPVKGRRRGGTVAREVGQLVGGGGGGAGRGGRRRDAWHQRTSRPLRPAAFAHLIAFTPGASVGPRMAQRCSNRSAWRRRRDPSAARTYSRTTSSSDDSSAKTSASSCWLQILAHHSSAELGPNPCGPARFFAKPTTSRALTARCSVRWHAARHARAAWSRAHRPRARTRPVPHRGWRLHTLAHGRVPPPARPAGRLPPPAVQYRGQLSHPSARPVIEGEALEVDDGDLVLLVSRWRHETRPLLGTAVRASCGFGWTVGGDFEVRPG